MPSPFPGMDPYLESPKHWFDFHNRFITHCTEKLNHAMPRGYAARSDERIQLVRETDDKTSLTRPDVSVMRFGPPPLRLAEDQPAEAGVGVAVLEREPVIVPIDIPEQETTHYIRIVQYPSETLVAVLELLSPSNKVEPGRGEYLIHRRHILHQPVHLIELDLLTGGKRLPTLLPPPQGNYFALVARADRRPNAEVYAWSVRERLPVIRIPLSGPDPDVLIDLQEIFHETYDNGRYRVRGINYGSPLKAPLAEADRAWAEERGRTG